MRFEDWNMNRMVYVVGNEQEQHFQFLFSIFSALGYPFAEKCFHMSYGMISLPDGKMKSREGNVVDADNLATDMHDAAKQVLMSRYPDLQGEALEDRAEMIAMAAIKFFILKYDAKKDFVFDRNQSLSFEGESGPYMQYTVARCTSILEKQAATNTDGNFELLVEPEERILLVLLQDFPQIIQRAANSYQPYLVARYLLELARSFNSYYQQHKVITDDIALTQARCALLAGIRQVLENGLRLLGIETMQQM
ncbi:MAG: arginine--tRNA ligase [Candidatus Peribacteria bacterium]|nr:MAG: arginine--tRNA ligase [Candidatus Peribacteria bacterium]